MRTETPLTVGTVARLAGVSVRTLHHYDEIGLVVPSDRTSSGYRLYGDAEINRLQEVLFFRELGFGLDETARMVAEPSYNRLAALSRHHALLRAKAERLTTMMQAIETAITAEELGIHMTDEEKLEIFGDFDPSEHEAEAKERWGNTTEYAESARRTNSYSKEDWDEIRAENDQIYADFAQLMRDGTPAESTEAGQLVERHRAHISKWYYDCTVEVHAGLGQMYVADPRFTNNIDKHGEGLAAYLSAATAAVYK